MPTAVRSYRRPSPALLLAVLAMSLVCCRRDSSPAEGGAAGRPASRDTRTLELVFTYGSEKEAWIRETTEAFNRQGRKTVKGKRIAVTAIPMGSGEAIEELLAGTRQAHLSSPASGAFIALGRPQQLDRHHDAGHGPAGTQHLRRPLRLLASWQRTRGR